MSPRLSRWRSSLALLGASFLLLALWNCTEPSDPGRPSPAQAKESLRARGPRVFVSNEDSGNISVLDSATRRVVDTIPVGKRPRGMRLSADGRFLFVAVSGSAKAPPGVDPERLPRPDRLADGIAIVEIAKGRVVRVLPSGTDPECFDLSKDEKQLYVSNEDAARASIFEIESGKLLASLEVGGEPEGVRTRPDGAVFYVTSEEEDTVAVVDPRAPRVIARVPAGPRPRSVLFTPDSRRAFVTSENGAAVQVIDALRHAPLSEISLTSPGARPMGLALSKDAKTLFVSTGRGKTVAFIDVDTAKVVAEVGNVGARPWGVGVSSDGRTLYTANGPSNDVSVIDVETKRVVARVPVGRSPWGVVVAP